MFLPQTDGGGGSSAAVTPLFTVRYAERPYAEQLDDRAAQQAVGLAAGAAMEVLSGRQAPRQLLKLHGASFGLHVCGPELFPGTISPVSAV